MWRKPPETVAFLLMPGIGCRRLSPCVFNSDKPKFRNDINKVFSVANVFAHLGLPCVCARTHATPSFPLFPLSMNLYRW